VDDTETYREQTVALEGEGTSARSRAADDSPCFRELEMIYPSLPHEYPKLRGNMGSSLVLWGDAPVRVLN
jgi:hypothetical protein